jgi:hypothetical protein
MKTSLKYIAVSALAFTLMASPFVGFAKEKENEKAKGNENKAKIEVTKKLASSSKDRDNDHDADDRNDHKGPASETSCFKAYGHLIAPGWFKNNGTVQADVSTCWLPFGIAKKFHGYNASTTPDVTAPVISNVTFNPAQTQSEVRWSTNENSNSVVFWNTTASVDTSDTATNRIVKNDYTKNHKVIIKNLTPNTTYYVVVKSKDSSNNYSISSVGSFITKTPVADTQVPVISNVVTIIGTSTVQVGWKTNENTTDRVYYSTILPVALNASTTLYASNTVGAQNHTLTIADLASNTTYYLVIESTDAAGNVTTSATFSVHTGTVIVPADVTPPVISSLGATPGSSTTTVTWTTNELATSKVYYSTINPLDVGTSTTQSILNGSLVTSHSISITGLATSTTYFFKVQSVDASGNTRTSDQISAITTAGM